MASDSSSSRSSSFENHHQPHMDTENEAIHFDNENERDSDVDDMSSMSRSGRINFRRGGYFGFDDVDDMESDDEHHGHGGEDNEEDGEDEDNYHDDEEDAMESSEFLRRLHRSRGSRHNDYDDNNSSFDAVDNEDEDEDEDDDLDDLDPRAEFLRAIGALSGGNREGRGQGFAEAVQRLIGTGIVYDTGNINRENSEMDAFINNINQRDDTYIILETLNELSERLLMMNGITAERLIPANKLAKALINVMDDPILEGELELHLVACRCLYNFLEVNQDFIHDALNNNAIESLCKKLMEISYIDLTEQALQTLEMISRDPISHNQIIANNGLKACLQYLDFLTTHAQRKCLTIVANSCTNVSISNFRMVKIVIDDILQVVRNHQDTQLVEGGWLAISRIIISFKYNPDLLEELFLQNIPLLKELTEIVYTSVNKTQNEDATKIGITFNSVLSLVKSIIILASVSVEISRILLVECNIGEMIVGSLNKYGKSKHQKSENVSIEALMAAPKELLSQFLNLIGYLLPITYSSKDTPFLKDNYEKCKEKMQIDEDRVALCEEVDFLKFSNDVWFMLINCFQTTMDFEIRKKVFINLFRIVSFVKEEDLHKIKGIEKITSLLVSVVNQGKISFTKEFFEECSINENDDMDVSSDHSSDESSNSMEKSKQKVDKADINANVLLLSSLMITLQFMKKGQTSIIREFEREGLIDDILFILNAFGEKYDKGMDEEISRLPSGFTSFTNKYIDIEFTKEYEYKLTIDTIYQGIKETAGKINEVYGSLQLSNDTNEASKHMKNLLEIKSKLRLEDAKSFTFEDWKNLWQKLESEIGDEIEGSQVSSFELNSSGIIKALASIFTSNDEEFGFEFCDCYRAFIAVFFVNRNTKPAISLFVSKLQEALIRSENFEIVNATGSNTSQHPLYQNQDTTTGNMAKQIKLKLIAEDKSAEQIPGNMKNMILSVHAIATFTSIGTFLKQRFKFFDRFHGLIQGSIEQDENDEDEDTTSIDQVQVEENKSESHIEFSLNGEVIPDGITIYGAIYRSLQSEPDEVVDPSNIWSNVHKITYRKVDTALIKDDKNSAYDFNSIGNDVDTYDEGTLDVLNLLKVFHDMNSFAKSNISNAAVLHENEFMNWKLTVKLNRQLEEPLVVASGTLPSWSIYITKKYPFIFPLETRIFFLQSTSFGYSRLIHQWQIRTNQAVEDGTGNRDYSQRPQLGRPTRHKVRISRKMILQSAIKVLGMYGSTPGILEIEYFDEVGSGLGPTLEFYSTVSKEFSMKKLKLWRDTQPMDDSEFVTNPNGLFPAPLDKQQIASENGKKVLFFFSSLGKFIARALLDSRIIDFNFNPVFLKMIQHFNQNNKTSPLDLKKMSTIASLRMIDKDLANSIEHLYKYVQQFSQVPENERDDIRVDGSTIRDLELYFELPGYPEYELIANGTETRVDASNIELYISRTLDATLYYGIIHQIKAFMDGFSKVFPISSLVIFSPKELVELFGNAEEDWSAATLISAINANHGYTKDSPAIHSLINILVNMNHTEKRAFLQFLTGAPKLPIGGFKFLRPELTVVRKTAEDGLTDDDYLPSVMTCANYLKLPNYSSEEIMRVKLLQAINEGAGAFLLS